MSDFYTFVMGQSYITQLKERQKAQPTHLDIGKMLKEAIPGFQDTLDAYGNGPEEHGSPYKVEGNKKSLIERTLRMKGYTKKGASWYRLNIGIDIGLDKDGNTRVYITDDN